MKILAIRGANIASLKALSRSTSRSRRSSAGLFAITGPTGAGRGSATSSAWACS